jgi:MFS family permease
MHFPKLKTKIFYGWWVLLGCAVIQFYFGGTFFQGFTAIFNPIKDEFGWSAALVSMAFSFRGFESGTLAPLTGFFVDKFGARKLMFSGVIIMAIGYWLFSRINSLWSFYAVFMIMSLGLSCCSGVVSMTAVAEWFTTRRSLAMGILTSGFGASGLLVPFVVWLVDSAQWRNALLVFAAGALVIGVPMSLLVKKAPAQAIEQASPKQKPNTKPVEIPVQMSTKEILRSRNFWFLGLALMFGSVAGAALTVHQIPYLATVGISRETAGLMVVVLSLANIAGRMSFGWLGDIFDKRLCFVVSTVLRALGVFAFAYVTSVGQLIAVQIFLGIGLGGLIPLRPTLQIQFFGMTSFALIQGLLMTFLTVGSIFAPLFAGWMYDAMGSYRIAWVVLAIVSAVALPLIMACSSKKEIMTARATA